MVEYDDKETKIEVIGKEPSPEDYCLTEITADTDANNADNWPVWYAEVSDYHAAAVRASLKVEADYRYWRGRAEEAAFARGAKTTVAAVKAEIEGSTRFHQYKVAQADAAGLVAKFAGWMRALELRMLLAAK